MSILCITRKTEEEIVIDKRIRVKIGSVKGERVRLVVDAPRDVDVDRLEVHEAKLAERSPGANQ